MYAHGKKSLKRSRSLRVSILPLSQVNLGGKWMVEVFCFKFETDILQQIHWAVDFTKCTCKVMGSKKIVSTTFGPSPRFESSLLVKVLLVSMPESFVVES